MAQKSALTQCFATSKKPLSNQVRLMGHLTKPTPHILELLEKWAQRGSGWIIDQLESLWLDKARYQTLRGSSYIPFPTEVQTKKAVINVKNKDDHCLRLALRSALNSATHHVDRPSQSLPWTTSTSRPLTPQDPSLRFQKWKNKTTWPSTSSAGKKGNYPPPQQTACQHVPHQPAAD